MRGMELGESRARRETPRGAPRGSPAAALTKCHTPGGSKHRRLFSLRSRSPYLSASRGRPFPASPSFR